MFMYGNILDYINCDIPIVKQPIGRICAPWISSVPEHTELFTRIVEKPKTFEDMKDVSKRFSLKFPKISINLPEQYDAIHVRKGDKVYGSDKQSENHSIQSYLKYVTSENLYVMTDDYSVIEKVKEYYKGTVFYLVDVSDNGFWDPYNLRVCLKEVVNNEDKFVKSDKYQSTMKLLEEVLICSKSQTFIGAYSSNVAKYIKLVHETGKCISIDAEWTSI